ncbi:archaetidylserine decarboxylase [Sphingomonas sp. 2R-10]|uniref:archaetidylserine decarboxylase n=1 Tax=Sphingomonas sp. 2R-10 TaxID=3045148 RepID=UPI000F797D36|nr:archaetidylserine decarboxylase [Sphingomonas sp. 2R-10]MDJ0278684.1 archaetidylserine decarboxylase [Sphingomonas sp. 2R-10]
MDRTAPSPIARVIAKLTAFESLNYAATNWLPRRTLTRAMGRFSKVEQPWIARASIAVWRTFSDVDLSDAAETRWPSMHACFIRRLRPGARTFAARAHQLASPSDGIIVASGRIDDDSIVQAKGKRYSVAELTGGEGEAYLGGSFVTLRLTAGMYHRFHAPQDGRVDRVRYFPGDCFNVNPPALKRVDRLYCRNERATVRLRLNDGTPVLLVPVAAILVAAIRLTFLDTVRLLRERAGPVATCDAPLVQGDEMGWFEHGSTIVMLVPAPFVPAQGVATGDRVRAGDVLFERGMVEDI